MHNKGKLVDEGFVDFSLYRRNNGLSDFLTERFRTLSIEKLVKTALSFNGSVDSAVIHRSRVRRRVCK